MVAIHFKSPRQRAEGYMLLAKKGRVRTLRGEIYVCNESSLAVLDTNNIAYERLPLPVPLNEMDTLRDTPTTAL